MKKILFIALLIPIAAFVITHGSDGSPVGQFAHIAFLAIICTVSLGPFALIYKFAQWHIGFHQKMKTNGIRKAPSA